jgi:putative methyltransferase
VHPSEPITKSEAYENGHIIIQDRASCFPAAILNPQPGDVLIDACAAPGNKTTHLAMLVQGNPGSITAFERDPKRANILRGMVARAGADKCVSVVCDDFTNTNPEDFVEVTGMVVDPSCSGSGIFGRGFDESAKDDSHDQTRLFKLQEFQTKIMSHALSFPNIQTVVYSTCSIHPEENEHVVRRLLEDSRFAKRFRVRPRSKVLPGWHRRGWPNAFAGRPDAKELADACVRAVPREDGGIGFFAVCFERIPGSQNLPTGEQSDHTHEDSNNDDYDEDEDEWAGFD